MNATITFGRYSIFQSCFGEYYRPDNICGALVAWLAIVRLPDCQYIYDCRPFTSQAEAAEWLAAHYGPISLA